MFERFGYLFYTLLGAHYPGFRNAPSLFVYRIYVISTESRISVRFRIELITDSTTVSSIVTRPASQDLPPDDAAKKFMEETVATARSTTTILACVLLL